MTYFSHIRASLISSALLLTTALASPAFAETLPEISPRQIASDVEVRTNPQSGAVEYLAPSFDPFEKDPSMAGTASLRSVSYGTTIDGHSVRGGALLDMTFYYNSASDDPYDTRGYEDAVYLSGEYASVTLRNNRILECNEQVQDVVYYHEDYYRPSLYVNLFRPYRHYRGHFGFNRGFGYDYGRGFIGSSRFIGRRGLRNRNVRDRRRTRNRRNTTDRLVDRAVDEARRAARQERRGNRTETRRTRHDNRVDGSRRARRHDNDSERSRRGNHTERRANRNRDRSSRSVTPRTNRASRMERVPTHDRAPRVRNNSLAGAVATRAASTARTASPRQAPAARAATQAPRRERAAPTQSRQRAASSSRRQNTERSRPARAERAVNRSRANKTRNTPRRNIGRKGNSKLRLMGFLPMTSAWSRNVVRNVDMQCAREEMLSVHIPQERLDAARFDGLTVIVLDRSGAEVPVFVPPNYIEGFRQAVSRRVTSNVSYQDSVRTAPVTREPVYQQPRPYGAEETPCPVGTSKQNDGTCLQGGTSTYGGYPSR